MGRFNIWDQRYDGLEINEKIRQIERDNLLYEQTEALKAQADASKKLAESNSNNIHSDDSWYSNYLIEKEKEELRLKDLERQEKAYVDSIWAGYNDLKEEIDNLKSRLKTYLYGTESYKELNNFIQEKEVELKEVKKKAEAKVTKYYNDKLNRDKRLNAERIRKERTISRDYELGNLRTSHAVWLFDIIFLGSLIGLPIAYFIDIQNSTNIMPIAIYSLGGYAVLNIITYFIRKISIINKWKCKKVIKRV